MGEDSVDPSKIIITACFEDRTRKRFTLNKDITVENFLKMIIADPSITKPQKSNPCIIKDGHLYDHDENLALDPNQKEFLVNVIWEPYIRVPKVTTNIFGMQDIDYDDDNTIVLEETIDDIADLLPNLFFGRINANEMRICGFIGVKRFLFGFILGIIAGPFSLFIFPCYDFDLSNILGVSLGVIVWIIGFLLITIKK